MPSVVGHEGQQAGQIRELEPHERVFQEGVEAVVEVVSVALQRFRPWNE